MEAPSLDFSRIGGSDTGAILGISPFVGDTPVSVWARIVAHRGMPGMRAPDDKDSDPIYWGNKLEPIVLDEIEERLQVGVERKPAPILHADFGFDLRANPDGLVVGRKGELVEAKTTNAFSDKVWREGVPRYYTSQADFYMAAFDAKACHVGCLVGGQRFRMHVVERNAQREKFLMGKLVEFWRYVEDGEPPPMVSSDDVDILYPDGSNELVAYADEEILEDLEDYRRLRAAARAVARIRMRMGIATVLLDGRRIVATLKRGADRVGIEAMRNSHPALVRRFTFEGARTLNVKRA